ncbi:hypothetical protein HYFRA_00009371 [Hymenoscyphus fraxineus]|uniref:Transcription initiation factor TFIID subunit 4 n=1 Tax=Hymenoscyphus fraxineus TaxID=746836 RepID=A0A9N9PVE1_9HELO|nr:hypothetical protein HYFRA_00009371 [Hymenoscyphus fraxineus]
MAQPPPQQQQQQFAMPMPQRQFSPQEPTATSPGGAPQQQFSFPPNKRQRLSPNPPSQPGSPYSTSPYAMSPGASGPQSAAASPHFTNVQIPPNVYNTPYANGHTTPTGNLNLPQAQPSPQLQRTNSLSFPSQNQSPNSVIPPNHVLPQNHGPPQNHSMPPNNNGFATNYNYTVPMQSSQGAGMMGPPSKPPEKPKEDGLDGMDVLGGTGVDLREEEAYLINESFNAQTTGSQAGHFTPGHSFSQFPPGDKSTFYGSGPANSGNEITSIEAQDEFQKRAADNAWRDATHALATSRQHELNNPFLDIEVLQRRAEKLAREYGLSLNVDRNGKMGSFKLPHQFSTSTLNVHSNTVPGNSTFTHVTGSFLPVDTQLADQIALMSLATKHRMRGLVEDAAQLAMERRVASHGVVPPDWSDVAVPLNVNEGTIAPEGGVRAGWEGAVDPKPQKRSLSVAGETPRMSNPVVFTLRELATKERDYEEERLKKRQKRETPSNASRPGSVVGTPGSIAPDISEKAPTKKEQSKKAQAKVNEAATHAAANSTMSAFMFGGKKQKKYSWMTGGGSGASTPGRPVIPGIGAPTGPPVPAKLTVDGVRRLGSWREDSEKGKHIQLRDLIFVLEQDGRQKKALQMAYLAVGESGPK